MNTELDWLKARYVEELNNLYVGEIENLNMLPQLVEVAHGPALKNAFQYHFEKIRTQIGRLNRIFANMSYWPVHITPGLQRTPVHEAGSPPPAIGESAKSDVVLVTTARQMEQHEIAGYLLALNCAEILRDHSAADLLEKTLSEEIEMDQVLAELGQPAPLGDTARVLAARTDPERAR